MHLKFVIQYADGTGGCDGCLNWEGVDVHMHGENYRKNFPSIDSGNNNGLGHIVRQLERVYTETNYPGQAVNLNESLKDSGKSRADLWAYAGIVAVEYGIDLNNIACEKVKAPNLLWSSCVHEPNTTECFVRPSRNIRFEYGRSDCTDFDPAYPYVTTKEEHHPNPVADGYHTVEFFKTQFGFTGRETVAIMGAHTYGNPKMKNSLIPYTWTSRAITIFNNDYYKSMTGQDRWFIDDDLCRKVGDAYGQKPATRWLAHTRKMTKRGGPVFWIKQNHVCPSIYGNPGFWSAQDKGCIKDAGPGQQCRPDAHKGSWGAPRTINQTDGNPHWGCEKWRLIIGRDEIALNCELGLYLDFKVTDGVPHGCRGLEHFAEQMASNASRPVWSEFPGAKFGMKDQPECQKQMLAEPPGSTPTSTIMDEYANNQTLWIDDYTVAHEKMIRNGYESLHYAPDIHTNLVCPPPTLWTREKITCYRQQSTQGPAFMLGNRFPRLNGKVYQYNPATQVFDFGDKTGAANQLWRYSLDGKQLINEMTSQVSHVSQLDIFLEL